MAWGTKRPIFVAGMWMWRVLGEREQSISQGQECLCLSIKRGRKASCSPDVELLARLRSSSATQDKFQYPLGTPVAVLLPNGPPVKTENPDFNLRSMPTHIRPCLRCQGSHWFMILRWVYSGWLLAIANIKCCSAEAPPNTATHRRLGKANVQSRKSTKFIHKSHNFTIGKTA